MVKGMLCCGLAALLACTNAPPGEQPDETRTDVAPDNDLVTSLEIEVGARDVRFVLHVTNPSAQPVTLEFANAQRYDFVVQTAAGAEVWRWSADQMFAQMLGEETLAAGASRDYSETWRPGERSGAFVAIARLVATNHHAEQRATFEIPKR
jgi:hypothetical protein